jgi:hypothetical protein
MHGHVIAHGYHPPLPIKNRAGIIAAFLDVRRKSRAAQGRAHLLRCGMEEVLENLKFGGVDSHSHIFAG